MVLEYRKLIGQGYDGVAPFAGKNWYAEQNEYAHSLGMHYTSTALVKHLSCWKHSMDQRMFGMMANMEIILCSPRKAEQNEGGTICV